MLKILIAEDEEPIANLIKMNLRRAGYSCVWAPDGEKAADLMDTEKFDLVLLDVMLPGINGYELMEYARSLELPVIFLTALGSTENKVKGLKMGADDYLTKPFEIVELLARVEAVLRRMGVGGKQLELGDVRVFTDSRQVMKGTSPVVLTAKEFDLLVELMQNKNIALYRDKLYEKVWKEPFFGETRTLDAHIQRLRKKLGWEERIKTVFRIGYRLEE